MFWPVSLCRNTTASTGSKPWKNGSASPVLGGLRGSQVIADEVGIALHDVVVAHIQVADGAPQVKAGPGTLPSHRRSLTEYFV